MYNYIKVRDATTASQAIPERITKVRAGIMCFHYFLISVATICMYLNGAIQDGKLEKKSSDIFVPNTGTGDEEAPLIPSAKLSFLGRTQPTNHSA